MKEGKEEQRFTRSDESLAHFSCGYCGKWWTIGDAPSDKNEWFCPWCGEKQSA